MKWTFRVMTPVSGVLPCCDSHRSGPYCVARRYLRTSRPSTTTVRDSGLVPTGLADEAVGGSSSDAVQMNLGPPRPRLAASVGPAWKRQQAPAKKLRRVNIRYTTVGTATLPVNSRCIKYLKR